MEKLGEKGLKSLLAETLHYESWYKESIEGKYGLATDGADHGRFRPSKNIELDKHFIDTIKFDKNGYSLKRDAYGHPYYKMENGVFYVDSAIKGFDFLPPSWQEKNLKAADVILRHIEHCIRSEHDMGKYADFMAELIHKHWVSRQVANESGGDLTPATAFFLGTLTADEAMGKEIADETQHSDLYVYFGKDRLEKIWGYQNFAPFDALSYEEKIKDYNQLLYGLKLVSEQDCYLSDLAKEYDYSLSEQLKNVQKAIEKVKDDEKEHM